jgi:uncharacterized heparinase superfamily protein
LNSLATVLGVVKLRFGVENDDPTTIAERRLVMTLTESEAIAELVERVQSWPAPMRIALARRILETLEVAPQPPEKRGRLTAEEVMALFQPPSPPPSLEESERALEEELIKKYAP